MVKMRNIPSNKTLPHLLSFYDCSRKRALGWRTLMLPTKTMSVFIFSFSSHIIYWETKEKAHLIVDNLKHNKVYVFYFYFHKTYRDKWYWRRQFSVLWQFILVVYISYHNYVSTIYNKKRIENMASKIAKQ